MKASKSSSKPYTSTHCAPCTPSFLINCKMESTRQTRAYVVENIGAGLQRQPLGRHALERNAVQLSRPSGPGGMAGTSAAAVETGNEHFFSHSALHHSVRARKMGQTLCAHTVFDPIVQAPHTSSRHTVFDPIVRAPHTSSRHHLAKNKI